MKPLVEIGFMPEALSTGPAPYRHSFTVEKPYSEVFTGWAYPPKDYGHWAELVFQWVRHCVERYGKAEVDSWWWEVWNEPNIGYWKGTPEEYHKLYDYSADAREARACPRPNRRAALDGAGHDKAREFLRAFLEHCARGQELRDRRDRRTSRLHRVPRQGRGRGGRWPRAHGHRQPAGRHRPGIRHRRFVSRVER